MGYLQPIHNQDIWVTDSNGDTWFNTGDLARQDKDGYFWLTGRKKEIIVRGGHNIEPKMIEEVLCQHPQVSLAAAVGQPDAYAGEIPTCYVQLLEGANIEEEELLKFAQENIFERAAIPKRIHILDSIPITPVGKVFKPALESMEIRRCIVREAENIHQDTSFEVKIVESSPHGKSAHVILTSWKDNDIESLKKSLAHYSFNVTLEM
jgi:fatty-acyl-CoA synthase